MTRSLITGICGQTGSYLAELLLEKGHEVIGLYRRSSSPNFDRIAHIKGKIRLIEGDVSDFSSLFNIIDGHKPNEIYNLAAQSHVKSSFDQPFYTTQVNYFGCLNILEICRNLQGWYREWGESLKIYQATTSECYGSCYDHSGIGNEYKAYQDENTLMKPNSPYSIAKLAAHNAIKLYRESYGIFACSGILFNHESPRRGEEFVTRKITKYLGQLSKYYNWEHAKAHGVEKLKLGNLDASRDWGFAGDYAQGIYLIMQNEKPDDFVLATGVTHTVKDFLKESFSLFNLNWQDYVEIDNSLKRPREVEWLCGRADKAKRILGWVPQTSFSQLVKMMIESDSNAQA